MDTPAPGRPDIIRTYLLEDISIRAGGDGRTVAAYAAVFNTPAEIRDQDGHYNEVIAPGAFDKTISERAGKIQVFYNHGKTIYGTPSERFSLPLGVPEEIRADSRGLFTVTRYARSAHADEVLELIRDGAIKGQSFSGGFPAGKSQRTPGANGELPTITRGEVALREYGPTPMPAYAEAAIVGVRMEELADTWLALTDAQRAELQHLIATSRTIGEPVPADEAAPEGTSAANDKPVEDHLSPAPSERRQQILEAMFRKDDRAA